MRINEQNARRVIFKLMNISLFNQSLKKNRMVLFRLFPDERVPARSTFKFFFLLLGSVTRKSENGKARFKKKHVFLSRI